jgi:arginase
VTQKIAVIVVPYELGRLREGVGRGPEHLLEAGATAALGSNGAVVHSDLVEIDPRFTDTGLGEGDAAIELIRLVSERVRAARAQGAFPVMLGGSCFAGVGVVAGLDEAVPGVVWCDAHSDFSEPATTTSGYFDSMGLAVLTGSAWQGLLATVPGATPVPESAVVLAGARAFDPSEQTRLSASQIVQLTAGDMRSPDAVVDAVGAIDPEITGLYVHLDLDVLDEAVATVNIYSEPGGVDGDELDTLLAALLEAHPVRAVSLTAYDPGRDAEDRVPTIALRLLRTLAHSL